MFRFGQFQLDPSRRSLRLGDRELTIGARAFDLLVALVQWNDRVVTKSELLDFVWPGVCVEEGNLAVQVSALRKLIGARSIVTVPGRGYRFVAALEPADRTDHGAEESATAIRLQGAATATASGSLVGFRNTLFGREDDFNSVRALLASHALVTIVGGSGIGKSALAFAIAAGVAGEGASGEVWTVQLAPVTDPARVAASVAGELQIPNGGTAVAEAIGRWLQPRRGLLVLDNCEHVVDAVLELADAIARLARGVVLLVTSQVPLKTDVERVHRLGGLTVPEEPQVAGALALFEARAISAQPSFVLSRSDWESAADICRRLDGNPLAIELAAARVPLLGVEGVRVRLDERFRLLRGPTAFVAARHRTLYEAVRWSEELLQPGEQEVLRRLAVFSGSFGMTEAQRVGAGDSCDEWDVLDRLGTLVERSLVSIETGRVPRYRLLETVRSFAAERLAAAGETERARASHAEAVAMLFESFDDRRWEMTSEQSHALLAPEIDNVRGALAWAREEVGRAQIGLGLAARAMWLWDTANLTAEGAEYLAFFAGTAADQALAPALRALFWSCRTFDSSGFEQSRESALDIPMSLQDRSTGGPLEPKEGRFLYDALARTAIHNARTGCLSEAREQLEAARALERPDWPPRKLAMRWFAEGELAEAEDRLVDALAAQEARAKLVELAGERAAQVHAAALLVTLHVAMGQIEPALELAARAMASIAPGLPDHRTRSLRVAWADALAAAGRPDDAAATFAPALLLYAGSASQWSLLDSLVHLCAARGDLHAAAQTLAASDIAYSSRGFVRKPYMDRARENVLAKMANALSTDEWTRLGVLGSALSEPQAIALAARAVEQANTHRSDQPRIEPTVTCSS